MKILAIGICGMLGVYSRYFLEKAINVDVINFPYSTFIVNLIGCLLIGFFYIQHQEYKDNLILPALMIGYCGGFTTFSSYSIQILDLFNSGQILKGFLYCTLSPLLGVAMVLLGMTGARLLLKMAAN